MGYIEADLEFDEDMSDGDSFSGPSFADVSTHSSDFGLDVEYPQRVRLQ